ncbi:MAG: chitobiase/beta-hexosaminidase C-terminal domain-containing protein [bacterium]|nr:MAG: chitobiase/beta-hexosaminidase C-terminal domain-containing protein [bacterium]
MPGKSPNFFQRRFHLPHAVLAVILLVLPISSGWTQDVTLQPPPGTYRSPVSLRILAPSGWVVHYTLDGSRPSTRSPLFEDSLIIDRDTVFKYVAVHPTDGRGKIMEALYRIEASPTGKEEFRTTAEPPGGDYVNRIQVRLVSRPGATIYYTLDGSEPDTSSLVFTTPLLIATDTVLRFFAVDETGEREPLRQERYVYRLIKTLVDTTPPVVSAVPSPEEFKAGDLVRMQSNEECIVYYTVDGSEPTERSSQYTEPLLLEMNTVLKFFAVDTQGNRSSTEVENYVVDSLAPTVKIYPDPGLYASPLTVRLEVSEEAASVYYTLDGSLPDEKATPYRAPIILTGDTLVRYFAVDRAGNRQEVQEARFVLDGAPPRTVVSPPGGTFKPPISVSLETEEGARIHYSVDGQAPNTAGPLYTSSFRFIRATTLQFFAVDGVGNREDIQTHRYTLMNGVWRKYARGVFLIPSVTNGKTFWMGSEAGLVVYRVGSGSRKFVGEREGLAGKRINDLVLDEEGRLWVATEEGLDRQDRGGGFSLIGKDQGLPASEVLGIGVDTDNSIWAGTSKGVAHIRDDRVVEVLTEQDGLVDDHVLTVAVDAQGNKWLGTRKGLSKFTGSEWRNFTKESGLVDNEIRTVAIDSDWKVWCGTNRGISVFDGEVWTSYRASDGLPSDLIELIAPDPDGEVWVATKAGVARFDGEKWIREESP